MLYIARAHLILNAADERETENCAAAFLMLYYLLSLRADLRFLKRLAKRQRPEEKLFFA